MSPSDVASTCRTTRNRKGRFIVLDGPDGSGKSTQAKLLAAELQARGRKALLLREPGGTALGEAVRGVLLERHELHMTALAEAFLFQAARAQLVAEVIGPALARGTWVICDRFALATLVYQGLAGGVDRRSVEQLTAVGTGNLRPDRYLVVWVPAGVGLERRADRTADRMEAKGRAFMQAVAAAYRREALRAPRQYQLVDGRGSVAEVRARIWRAVEPLLR